MAVLMKKDFPERVIEVRVPFRLRPKGRRHVKLSAFLSLGIKYLSELFKLRLRVRVTEFTGKISQLTESEV